MEEDDLFLGDDLDDIPDNTLLELEQNAISSTQRQRPTPAPRPQPLRKQAHNASSLARSQKPAKNLPWRPPQRQQQPQAVQTRPGAAPPASAPEPPSSDYGMDGEHVIDLDEPSMIIQPASGPQSRAPSRTSSRPVSNYGGKAALDAETAAAFAAADAEMGGQMNGAWAQAPHLQHRASSNAEMASLQARIAQLETEQNRLRKAEQDARNASLARQGEISIVRANQEKEKKEFERRISVMQKLHSDEAAKHKAELEATRKEREKMETDNRFLQHDLAQEAERAKRTNGPVKPGLPKEKDTPRKTKRKALGDGFDDDEVLTVSPSRSREKSKDQTPKAGAKRKRSAQDSPLPALSFAGPQQPVQQVNQDVPIVAADSALANARTDNERERYRFMQRMLDHRRREQDERTIELFAKHSFPSTPGRTLSSIFFDGIAALASPEDGDSMALKTSRTLLKLWASCIQDKSYAPLALILDMLRAALDFEYSNVINKLIEEAVPLCLYSMDLVVTPLLSVIQRPSLSASFDYEAQAKLAAEVDIDEVVDFLHLLGQSAELYPERNEAFWRTMQMTSTLVMLSRAQPVPRLITGLQILRGSILDASLGPINEDAMKQEQQERATVDRLTSLLFDSPAVPKDEPPYSDEEIAELRLETLLVLKQMCLTDHGGLLLAQHRSAIGRLVKFLDGQVCKLYDVTPDIGRVQAEEDDQPTAHGLIIKTVDLTVRLLHHLLHAYESSIDLQQKLAAVHGGYHRFLISLTRVAFSEQLVFEQGIETEVVEAAHEILDNVLSPEEGEAIVKAVETPRGTRSTTTHKNTSGASQDDEMDTEDG